MYNNIKLDYFTHKRKRKNKVKEIVKEAFLRDPNSDGNMMAYLDDFIDDNIEFDSKGRTIKPLYVKKIIRDFLNSVFLRLRINTIFICRLMLF